MESAHPRKQKRNMSWDFQNSGRSASRLCESKSGIPRDFWESIINPENTEQAPQAREWPPVVAEILAALERATRKFPTWPTDPLHALAVLGEEFGETTKAVLQQTYEPHKTNPGEVRTEAMQTAAMALRFLASLDQYVYADDTNVHRQSLPLPAAPGEGAL